MKPHAPIREALLLIAERVGEQIAHPSVAFRLDQRRTVRKRLFHIVNNRSLGRKVGTLYVRRGLGALRRFDKEVEVNRDVQQLLGERTLRRVRLEIVFLFWKVFRHCDQLAADIVPVVQQDLRRAVGGLRRGWRFGRILSTRGLNRQSNRKHNGEILHESSHGLSLLTSRNGKTIALFANRSPAAKTRETIKVGMSGVDLLRPPPRHRMSHYCPITRYTDAGQIPSGTG